MKVKAIVTSVIFLLASIFVFMFFFEPQATDRSWKKTVILSKGGSAAQLSKFFNGSEMVSTTQNGLIKKDWLLALEVPGDSQDNYWENREKFGYINNPQSPTKMPIGYAWSGDYLSSNCATCHTSFVQYEDTLLAMPGGTNRSARGAYFSTHYALADTVLRPDKFGRFASKVLGADASIQEKAVFREEVVERLNAHTTSYIAGLTGIPFKDYQDYVRLSKVGNLLSTIRGEGQGKGGHPFIVGRNLWMGEHNYYSKNNGVDIPYIYDFENMDRIHYNGSTNSVLERNIVSTLNTVSVPTLANMIDVDPRALDEMEKISAVFSAPEWPEKMFGEIDREKAVRGEQIYQAQCASCHAATVNGPLEMKSFSEAETGTDGAYFDLWREPVKNLFGKDELSYAEAMQLALGAFKKDWFEHYGVDEQEAYEMDPKPWWNFKTEWIGRPLPGIWSTAPYLHNGSVPTLYHLLLPPSERPNIYTGGSLRMDAAYVGVDWSTPPSIEEGTFTFDTSEYGRGNQGHDYATDLPEAQRMELIEYLKTL